MALCFRQQQQQGQRKGDAGGGYSPVTYQVFDMVTGEVVAGEENTEGCFGLHNSCTYIINNSYRPVPIGDKETTTIKISHPPKEEGQETTPLRHPVDANRL